MKFDDCVSCRFRRKPQVCRDCDVGELYEDREAQGVDHAISQPSRRFGESVSADDTSPTFDPNRFADSYEESDNDDDDL